MDSSHRIPAGRRIPPEVRFWPKVDAKTPTGCWLWMASLDGHGYGQFGIEMGHLVRAHRFAYEQLVGPIPEGLHLDHLCRNKRCVNPAHLEPVTNRENLLRGDTFVAVNVAKTHCIAGHPYEGDNLHVDPKTGKRRCKTCHRLRAQRERDRSKAVDE